jgi:16S rRNA G966 N2-methylase RsmD
MIRLKRLMNGEEDPYLTATQISRGTTVLDCTLGLGSEAIVASFAVGSQGKVTAIEENPIVGFVVKTGLSTYNSGHSLINEAMQRIHVQIGNHYDRLKKLSDNQFDVVYFDPMFEKSIDESTGIQPLSPFASLSRLTETTIKEAKRVARNRVVLKAHYQSSLFTELGFYQVKRKTALFHYGYIEL